MVKINPQTGCAGGARSSDDWDEKIVSRAAAVAGADQSRSKLLMKLKVRLVLEAKSLFVRVLSHPDYFLLWARQLLNLSGFEGRLLSVAFLLLQTAAGVQLVVFRPFRWSGTAAERRCGKVASSWLCCRLRPDEDQLPFSSCSSDL